MMPRFLPYRAKPYLIATSWDDPDRVPAEVVYWPKEGGWVLGYRVFQPSIVRYDGYTPGVVRVTIKVPDSWT